MRKLVIAGFVATALAGGAAATHLALADEDPPGPGGMQGSMMEHEDHSGMMGPGMMGPGMMGPMWMHHMMAMRHGGMGLFGLFAPVEDRALTTADVQKIAEALLLWHGNHAWKVVDVKEAADNRIDFAYATAEGSVIARFSVDRKTGMFRRLG